MERKFYHRHELKKKLIKIENVMPIKCYNKHSVKMSYIFSNFFRNRLFFFQKPISHKLKITNNDIITDSRYTGTPKILKILVIGMF